MFSSDQVLMLLLVAGATVAVVPLVGGACLWLMSRFAKIPDATFGRCYRAYLTAYVLASILFTAGAWIGGFSLTGNPSGSGPALVLGGLVLLGFFIHLVVIRKFLRVSWRTSLLVHGSAVLMVGVVFALASWPFIVSVRAAAQRAATRANLLQIGRAMFSYEAAHGTFPAAASYDAAGRPLLSWRVHLLPYLEQQALYEEFRLDEPWDSPHNLALLPQMPAVYANAALPAVASETTFQLLVQNVIDPPNTPDLQEQLAHPQRSIYELVSRHPGMPAGYQFTYPLGGPRLTQIQDGLSRTLNVVEAPHPVAWTRPADVVYDPRAAAPVMHREGVDRFSVLLFDGSVADVPSDIPERALRAAISFRGYEEDELPTSR